MRIHHLLFSALLAALVLPGCNRALAPAPDRRSNTVGAVRSSDAGDRDALPASCRPQVIGFSEILYDPAGADGDGAAEFIELRGQPGESIVAHTLVLINGADSRSYDEIPLQLRLNADGLAVVSGAASGQQPALRRSIQNGPDSAQLIRGCDGAIVDSIAWPPDTAHPGEGWAVGRCEPDGDVRSLTPSPGLPNTSAPQCADRPGQDGEFTDAGTPDLDVADGAHDSGTIPATDADGPAGDGGWPELDTTHTELAQGEPATTECNPGESGWRLNEVLYNPDGADSPETEFVELRHLGDPRFAEPLRLQHIDGGSGELLWDRAFVTPVGLRTMLVELNEDTETNSFPRLPTLQNGPDSLLLLDCAERELDRLDWAGSTAEPARPGFHVAGSGESLSRCNTDGSPDDADFGAAEPSPGRDAAAFLEAGFCATPCPEVSSPSQAFLATVLYDPPGLDEGFEFVTLGGPPGQPTRRLTLQHFSPDSDAPRWTAQIDGRFDESQGLHVVGGDAIIPRDTPLPSSLLNRAGVLVLNDCRGNQLERIEWGQVTDALPALASGCAATRTSSGTPWRVCCEPRPGDATCPQHEGP
jgi:hypothetical protein